MRCLLFILPLLASYSTGILPASEGKSLWQHHYGTSGVKDRCLDVELNSLVNIVACGDIAGFGYIHKYTQAPQMIWKRSLCRRMVPDTSRNHAYVACSLSTHPAVRKISTEGILHKPFTPFRRTSVIATVICTDTLGTIIVRG